MGFLLNRITVLSNWADELLRHGCPVQAGADAPRTLILLDGVGGWYFGPLMMRRALRRLGARVHTVIFDWHTRFHGNLLGDLMWLRKNRVAACRLARMIRSLRRAHPDRSIHIAAYSGGCGIAAFALERLKHEGMVDTAILLAPALSPAYDLAPALRCVRRMIVGVSPRDRFLLGAGTRIFGTMDRKYSSAAGRLGFKCAEKGAARSGGSVDVAARLETLCWTTDWKRRNHHGGHTAWIHPSFLEELLVETGIAQREGAPDRRDEG